MNMIHGVRPAPASEAVMVSGPMPQDHLQRAVVNAQQSLEETLGDAVEPGSLLLLGRTQEAAAQHGRQRHRDNARNQDRHADGDGKLAEQAAQDAAHEQHRNEHGRERQRHGNDGEADFASIPPAPRTAASRPSPCAGKCFPASRWRRPPRSRRKGSAPSWTGCPGCSAAGT